MPRNVYTRSSFSGALHDMLAEKMPEFAVFGRMDQRKLATHLGVCHRSVREWMLTCSISRKMAMRIIEGSDGRVTVEDMYPFVRL